MQLLTPRGQLPNWPIEPWAAALRAQLADPRVTAEDYSTALNQAALIEHHRGQRDEARRLCDWHLDYLLARQPAPGNGHPSAVYLIQPMINVARLLRSSDPRASLALLDDLWNAVNGCNRSRLQEQYAPVLHACCEATWPRPALAAIEAMLLGEMVLSAMRLDSLGQLLSEHPDLTKDSLFNEALLRNAPPADRHKVRFDAVHPAVLLILLGQQEVLSWTKAGPALHGLVESSLKTPPDKDAATLVIAALKVFPAESHSMRAMADAALAWSRLLGDEVVEIEFLRAAGHSGTATDLARRSGYARLATPLTVATELQPLFSDLTPAISN